MPKFRTIKALVLDYVHRKKGIVNYDELTEKVLANFPGSAWKRTHWAWYRYQILRGRFRDQFTSQERQKLKTRTRSNSRSHRVPSSERPSRSTTIRKSAAKHRTIKALVLDYVHRQKGVVNEDKLAKEVTAAFPSSAWKRTHWAWYRSQILDGRFTDQFTKRELKGLHAGLKGRGPVARDQTVKKAGDKILKTAREAIAEAAGADQELYFKVNRWVFARLLQDEIRVKRPIKKKLWESGMRACQACGEAFKSLKGVEIHRKDGSKGYSVKNCELLCRGCHQENAR